MSGPLAGYRIIDLSTVVMAPFATQILCDYGADVIKVESPEGDILREAGPGRHPGMGHLHLNTNRGKRSVVLNLKDPEGREALLDIAKTCDALVYNLRPSAMARLRLAYEDLAAVNERIIYLGAFGFSQRGPYANRPAYDDLIQGMAGIPWLSQLAGSDAPRYAPIILADKMVGAMTANALLAALLHRERTGRGQRVDVPMFESLASVVLGEHLAGKMFEPPIGPVGYPRSLARRPYRTRDGYLCAMVYSDKHWRAFLAATGKPELFADPRFCSHPARHAHIEEVYAYLADVLATRRTSEWLELFRQCDIPAERMYSVDDILDDEHMSAIGFFTPVEHPSEGRTVSMAIPSEWSDSRPDARGHAPRLGQHTEEVLREIGAAPERIARLRNTGETKANGEQQPAT